MSDTLYMQIDMNILVKHPHVYLQDIARLSCTSTKAPPGTSRHKLRTGHSRTLYNVCDGSRRSDSEKGTGS